MNDEQRILFETNGYLVIPTALPPEQLAEVRQAADRAEAAWRAGTHEESPRVAGMIQVQSPIEYDPLLCNLLIQPTIFPIVRELLGDDVMMIDNDYFITPPGSGSHAHWHHDVTLEGVYHPRSTLMVKVFYLLSDVPAGGGATALIPGSHRFPMDFRLPTVANPGDMPGHVRMEQPAGTAYLFNGRIYHAALNNESELTRRTLIYNYGHFWMKMWPGYEPTEALRNWATGNVMRQLLGIGEAYQTSLAE